jgi:ketosteroid isomerase-like protein
MRLRHSPRSAISASPLADEQLPSADESRRSRSRADGDHRCHPGLERSSAGLASSACLPAGLGPDPGREPSSLESHRRLVEAFNAREAPYDLLAPDFRMDNRRSAVTDYTYRGAVGFRDWMSDVFEVFANGARYEVDEIIAVRDELVAATVCITGRGARSKMPLEFRWTGVTWFREGRVTRITGYASRRDALEAVELHDQARQASPLAWKSAA